MNDALARGIAFAVERLSAGAQALRDMIVDAWFDSEQAQVGYPMGAPCRDSDRHPSHEIGWHAWSRACENLGYFW